MSAPTSLQACVELYLAERTRLGYCSHDAAGILRSFARHVQVTSHRGPLTVEVMAAWARCDSRGSSDPHTWARRLGPAPGLRGVVFETLFGLLASTGLRIGEALALRNQDVNLKTGMLGIYQTKFGKSRQVPMHPSTLDALRRYRWMRDLCGEPVTPEGAFFVGTRGRHRCLPLGDRQVQFDASCSGKLRVWVLIRPCCRCPPTWALRR